MQSEQADQFIKQAVSGNSHFEYDQRKITYLERKKMACNMH